MSEYFTITEPTPDSFAQFMQSSATPDETDEQRRAVARVLALLGFIGIVAGVWCSDWPVWVDLIATGLLLSVVSLAYRD